MGEMRIGALVVLLCTSACSGEDALVIDGRPSGSVSDGAVDAASDGAVVAAPDGAVVAAPDAAVDAVPDGNTMAVCPDGTPQTLAECVSGLFWADCGGIGPTKLACREARCSWFTTSCLPAGYEASDCAANGICCHEGFPFVKLPTTWLRDIALFLALWGHGSQPWNADRELNIDVVIDPALEHAAAPGFTCNSSAENTVCDPRTTSAAMRAGQVGGRITFVLGEEFFPAGTVQAVEVDPSRLRARVCDQFYTDNLVLLCHNMPIGCFTSGTLTLPKIPESAAELSTMAYRLDVMRGAFRLQGAF